jgi:hypothetical protein
VEARSLVSESLLSSTESTEVLSGLWDDVAAKLHLDAASWLTTNGNIKENGWKRPVFVSIEI